MTYTFSRLFSLYFSIKKLEENEPIKKERINSKYIVHFQKLKLATSNIKSAKCPVTLVVNCLMTRKPDTLTIPATNDNTVAICRLCLKVLLLP